MKYLKENFSLLFSPIFWGWTLSALLKVAAIEGWIDVASIDVIANFVILVTGTGTAFKFGSKVAGK